MDITYLQAQVAQLLPDNGVGSINAARLRQAFNSIITQLGQANISAMSTAGTDLDTVLSLNRGLSIRNPLDFVINTELNLQGTYLEYAGKRIALNGQTERNKNGVYLVSGTGAITRFNPTQLFQGNVEPAYYDTYQTSALFRCQADNTYWFVPVTKQVSNTDVQDAFNFINLPETAISIYILDNFEQSGQHHLSEFSSYGISPTVTLPRPLLYIQNPYEPDPFFVVNANIYRHVTSDQAQIAFNIPASYRNYIVFLLTAQCSTSDILHWEGRLSNAYLLDEIRFRLLPMVYVQGQTDTWYDYQWVNSVGQPRHNF